MGNYMPMYEFECKQCKKVTETVNCLRDSDRPPEQPCTCGADEWTKLISGSSFRWRYVDQEPPKRKG